MKYKKMYYFFIYNNNLHYYSKLNYSVYTGYRFIQVFSVLLKFFCPEQTNIIYLHIKQNITVLIVYLYIKFKK